MLHYKYESFDLRSAGHDKYYTNSANADILAFPNVPTRSFRQSSIYFLRHLSQNIQQGTAHRLWRI